MPLDQVLLAGRGTDVYNRWYNGLCGLGVAAER